MKLLFLANLVICCLSGVCYAQSPTKDSTFANSCNLKYCYCDSVIINNEVLKYFIVSKTHRYRDQNNNNFYRGTIILYTDKGKYTKNELQKLFSELGEKNNLATFTVFNTCRAYEFSVSAMGEPPGYKGYIDEHHLGSFDRTKEKSK